MKPRHYVVDAGAEPLDQPHAGRVRAVHNLWNAAPQQHALEQITPGAGDGAEETRSETSRVARIERERGERTSPPAVLPQGVSVSGLSPDQREDREAHHDDHGHPHDHSDHNDPDDHDDHDDLTDVTTIFPVPALTAEPLDDNGVSVRLPEQVDAGDVTASEPTLVHASAGALGPQADSEASALEESERTQELPRYEDGSLARLSDAWAGFPPGAHDGAADDDDEPKTEVELRGRASTHLVTQARERLAGTYELAWAKRPKVYTRGGVFAALAVCGVLTAATLYFTYVRPLMKFTAQQGAQTLAVQAEHTRALEELKAQHIRAQQSLEAERDELRTQLEATRAALGADPSAARKLSQSRPVGGSEVETEDADAKRAGSKAGLRKRVGPRPPTTRRAKAPDES